MTPPGPPQWLPEALADLLRRRVSVRRFAERPLDAAALDRVLWAAQGRLDGGARRTAPSADGLYPLGLAVLARNVDGLGQGCYLQHPFAGLEPVEAGPGPGRRVAEAAVGEQPWLFEAPAIVVVSGDLPAMLEHFADQQDDGRRGERYLAMEAGCAAHNAALYAAALGLGSVLVGGFDDALLSAALEGALEPGHVPLALLAVGHPHTG
ncbi:SagB-type dehydrogenase family enzyme [Murinocardiopsis flavida]|uniref:SagB-type dehydrogenase family enzyme n=1 Tax=Murinocardiopsis flavida TaxID=645275 RepID=A0A2P8DNY5_9ACTN|nr:nitroreductase family protein [Murinocardiopsis flavida]PSK98934.1 SagB-type dehydrogenase family enzyme [Murinocardiopsis flavida]